MGPRLNREAAWDELLAATPPGWYVGRPSPQDERGELGYLCLRSG
jgi:hypothetical protein